MLRLVAFLIVFVLQLTAFQSVTVGKTIGILERVKFVSADHKETLITGRILKPEGKGPFSSVIMLHGCSGLVTKSGKLKQRPTFWSRWLGERGLIVLMVNSFTPRGLNSICRTKNRTIHPDRERPFDAYGALLYLQSRPDVLSNHVFLMGWSNGAMTLLWTIKSNSIARPKMLTYDFRAAIAFYPGCTKLSKSNFSTKIPVLLQLGKADDWTPVKPCLRLMKAANLKGSLVSANVYPGAYHNFDHPTSRLKVVTTLNSVYKTGEKKVHTGKNSEARSKAIANVAAFLDQYILPSKRKKQTEHLR